LFILIPAVHVSNLMKNQS